MRKSRSAGEASPRSEVIQLGGYPHLVERTKLEGEDPAPDVPVVAPRDASHRTYIVDFVEMRLVIEST